jgi:hypothetical protein
MTALSLFGQRRWCNARNRFTVPCKRRRSRLGRFTTLHMHGMPQSLVRNAIPEKKTLVEACGSLNGSRQGSRAVALLSVALRSLL